MNEYMLVGVCMSDSVYGVGTLCNVVTVCGGVTMLLIYVTDCMMYCIMVLCCYGCVCGW